MLSSIISSLQQLVTSDGSNFASLQSYLQNLKLANTTAMKQANLGEKYFLESYQKPFLTCLIDNLKKGLKISLYLPPLMYLIQKIPRVSNDSSESDSEEECNMEKFT